MIYLFTLLPVLLALSFLLKPRFIVTKVLVNTFRIVGTLAFTLLVLRLYVFDIYKIPSGSMERTLLVGDKIIIQKNKLPKHNELVVFEEIKEVNPTVMVKRVVGTPGDSLYMEEERVYANRKLLKESKSIQRTFFYNDETIHPHRDICKTLNRDVHISKDRKRPVLLLTYREVDSLNAKYPELNIRPTTRTTEKAGNLYPRAKQLGNNRDNFHPFWVPAMGKTIEISKKNLWWYKKLINYENEAVEFLNDSTIKIDRKEYHSYTFKENYYYMLGDNRHRSRDSRFWGFVPENHLYGKVLFALSPSFEIKRVFQ